MGPRTRVIGSESLLALIREFVNTTARRQGIVLADLAGSQRRALELALLRAEPGDAPAIAVGFRSLLRMRAAQMPLVIAVDDVERLVGPSLEVLTFLARRLSEEPMALSSRSSSRAAAWFGVPGPAVGSGAGGGGRSGTGGGSGSGSTGAPVLCAGSVTPRRLHTGQRRLGMTSTSDDRSAATTTLRVARIAPGRKARGLCVAVTQGNRRNRTCSRSIPLGLLTHGDQAGVNGIQFIGRLRGRTLAPGRYRFTTRAANPGKRSPALTLTFTVAG